MKDWIYQSVRAELHMGLCGTEAGSATPPRSCKLKPDKFRLDFGSADALLLEEPPKGFAGFPGSGSF